MATVTSPILTDATFATKMDALAAAVKPDASDIPLTPPSGMTATNVQDGFSEIKQSLSDLVQSITLSNQTTNSQGMIITNLNFDGKWISAYVSGGRYASFRPSGSDKLVIRLVNDNGEAVTNTSVNVTLYHIGAIS